MGRDLKSIGIFNVVRFPNNVCDTNGNMNGTCYTAEECTSRDGVATGSCADGYGVCCVITLSCGSTTTENCTYLQQVAATDPATDSDTSLACTYTICPATATVPRIRFDLTAMELSAPYETTQDGNAGGGLDASGAIGQCNTHSFSVVGTGGPYPVICGTNNGQHLIADTDGKMCVTAVFKYGVATNSRSYTIHVIQYEEMNEMGGPAGCLQFFSGDTGTVNTFNWNGIGASTHLANQNYDVCIRQRADRCRICWSTVGMVHGDSAAMTVGTFGVSNAGSADGAGMAGADDGPDDCVLTADQDSNDFVIIAGGIDAGADMGAAGLNTNVVAPASIGMNRFCGRYFNFGGMANQADASICTRSTPFKLGVRFDGLESTGAAAMAVNMGQEGSQEASGTITGGTLDNPLATMGFSLGFTQLAC